MRRANSHLLIAALAVCLLACSSQTPPSASNGPLEVTVSIPPLAGLVTEVGGDRVTVHTLLAPGRSPATYEPTPAQLAALENSRLLILTGVPFERVVRKRVEQLYPDMTILELNAQNTDHAHGCSHDGLDPHTWLSPPALADQAEAILAELVRVDPSLSDDGQPRLAEFKATVSKLDSAWAELFARAPTKRFYCYHPAYGWLAHRYGLEQIAIEHEGKEPSPAQLAALIEQARTDSIGTIFVQQQFADRSAAAVAEAVGARLHTLDPLAEQPLENLQVLVEAIAAELHRRPHGVQEQTGTGE